MRSTEIKKFLKVPHRPTFNKRAPLQFWNDVVIREIEVDTNKYPRLFKKESEEEE